MTNILHIMECIIDANLRCEDCSKMLTALDCAVENYANNPYRWYTIYSLRNYKDTGLCSIVFDGKVYSL